MRVRNIIVNADDLGLSPSVNTAIFEVFRAGNLNSATVMANMPGTADAVERLAVHKGLAVGLHFCLTEGYALTGISSITDHDGGFMDRGTLWKAVLRGRVRADDIRDEFEAQWQRMTSAGVGMTHVDSHQHVLMFPPVFKALVPVLERLRLPVRVVEPPWRTVTADLVRPLRAAKQLMNVAFARMDRRLYSGPSNRQLVSVHDLAHTGPYSSATYLGLLERTSPEGVVEVMIHPYILGEDVLDLYRPVLDTKMPFLQRCVAEHAVLSQAPVFKEHHMVTFADLVVP